MLIAQGLLFFVLYYLVFHFTILGFNLLTPGCEFQIAGDETDGYDVNIDAGGEGDETQKRACRYIISIGGSDNLTGIDACITRLRLSVKDTSLVNDAVAKNLVDQGVIHLHKESLKIIVCTREEIIARAMRTVLANGTSQPVRAPSPRRLSRLFPARRNAFCRGETGGAFAHLANDR